MVADGEEGRQPVRSRTAVEMQACLQWLWCAYPSIVGLADRSQSVLAWAPSAPAGTRCARDADEGVGSARARADRV